MRPIKKNVSKHQLYKIQKQPAALNLSSLKRNWKSNLDMLSNLQIQDFSIENFDSFNLTNEAQNSHRKCQNNTSQFLNLQNNSNIPSKKQLIDLLDEEDE